MTYVPADDGTWISQEFANLAEVIHDYYSTLEFRWIPPEYRTAVDSKPYCVWDTSVDKPVFFANELDSPTSILARLFRGDNSKKDVLKDIEAMDAAQEVLKHKAWLDELEDLTDQAMFMFKSPKNYMKMNGKKFDDQRRTLGSANGKVIL